MWFNARLTAQSETVGAVGWAQSEYCTPNFFVGSANSDGTETLTALTALTLTLPPKPSRCLC